MPTSLKLRQSFYSEIGEITQIIQKSPEKTIFNSAVPCRPAIGAAAVAAAQRAAAPGRHAGGEAEADPGGLRGDGRGGAVISGEGDGWGYTEVGK